jgi:murein DD-endopeptidase MepM/ murein hydrolase activator NlpD
MALTAAVVIAVVSAPVARAGSANVAALQVALEALGLSPGTVDGVSGPATRGAVRRLQLRRHLSVDGVAGLQTRRALGSRGRPGLGARAMKEGQRGWDIAALQYLLNARGFGPGGYDGGFGSNTADAVRSFQSAAGLDADGVAGTSTLAALRRRQLSAPASSADGPVRFLRPVGGPITGVFGEWRGDHYHSGVDFGGDTGTPIHAAGRGTVTFAGWNDGGYGNLVVIQHRLGFETYYGHMSAVNAWDGESVDGGTVIGYVGSTGHSTGPHLHFEVREYGTPIDPMPRMLGATAARVRGATRSRCRPNADAWGTRDADPAVARIDRCP